MSQVTHAPPRNQQTDTHSIDLKAEVRKTHFQLGSTSPNYVSHTVGTLIEHPISKEQVLESEKNKHAQLEKNRKANFKLPNQKYIQTEQTTYK